MKKMFFCAFMAQTLLFAQKKVVTLRQKGQLLPIPPPRNTNIQFIA
jgi:hypothetical protein